jgi:hypothetical protein
MEELEQLEPLVCLDQLALWVHKAGLEALVLLDPLEEMVSQVLQVWQAEMVPPEELEQLEQQVLLGLREALVQLV